MYSRQEIYEKLAHYMVEMFELPRDKITLDAHLGDDLDLDSIDAVDLAVKLQDLTGRRINPAEFKNIRTVSDVVDCVEKLLAVDEIASQ